MLAENDDLSKSISNATKELYGFLRQKGNKFHNFNVVHEIFPEASDMKLHFDAECVDDSNDKHLITEFIENNVTDSLLFWGEGGIGKTTAMFHLLESFCNGNHEITQIPIYLELNKCPINVSSWCKDDKHSFYIEKTIAELVLGKRFVNLDDDIISQIDEEFQKEPLYGKPKYLILLDGLNEVSSLASIYGLSPRMLLEKEIEEAILRFKNVRFIITTRNDATQIKNARRIQILGIDDNNVLNYLDSLEKKGQISSGVRDIVSMNSELLECLRIPLFLSMFVISSENPYITTRGEILRDFFHKKRHSLYSNQIEGKTDNGIILDFIIPEIAWYMYIKDIFDISRNEIIEIAIYCFTDVSRSILLSKYLPSCFELLEEQSVAISEIKNGLLSNVEQQINKIISIVLNDLSLLYENKGTFSFQHQHFRDYFSAVHIINQMKMIVYTYANGLLEENACYAQDLCNNKLNQVVVKFISEALDVHYSNHSYHDGKWFLREWKMRNELILQMINLYRERFSDIGWTIWNLVQIINSSGMGLLGVDLSDLNLENIEFNGILCGIDSNYPDLATNFDGSIVRLESFLPIGHEDTVKHVHFNIEGTYIVTVSDSEIIIWDRKYSYVRKWKSNDIFYNDAFFCNDTRNIVCHLSDNSVIIYDIWVDKEPRILGCDNSGGVVAVCSGTPSHLIYVVFENLKIKIYNLQLCKFQGPSFRCDESIFQLVYDRTHSKLIGLGSSGSIWSFSNGIRYLKLFISDKHQDIAISSTGKHVGLITDDGHAQFSNDYTTESFEQLPFKEIATNIYISPDGSHVGVVCEKIL